MGIDAASPPPPPPRQYTPFQFMALPYLQQVNQGSFQAYRPSCCIFRELIKVRLDQGASIPTREQTFLKSEGGMWLLAK